MTNPPGEKGIRAGETFRGNASRERMWTWSFPAAQGRKVQRGTNSLVLCLLFFLFLFPSFLRRFPLYFHLSLSL
jgi:hypothetical protein